MVHCTLRSVVGVVVIVVQLWNIWSKEFCDEYARSTCAHTPETKTDLCRAPQWRWKKHSLRAHIHSLSRVKRKFAQCSIEWCRTTSLAYKRATEFLRKSTESIRVNLFTIPRNRQLIDRLFYFSNCRGSPAATLSRLNQVSVHQIESFFSVLSAVFP